LRHVRAARRHHPLRLAIEAAIVEKGRWVAGILEIDDPQRPPCGIRTWWLGSLSVLVHEPHERPIPKAWKPGGRSGISMVGEPAPEPARIGRPAPECAVEWIAHHFDQVRRLLGIRGAETDPMQIKFWAVVLRKRGPVSVDLLEQSACDVGAVARV